MNGKECRAFARENINGCRGFLFGAILLSMSVAVLVPQVFRSLQIPYPPVVSFLVSVVSALLSLGSLRLTLEQVEGKKKSFSGMWFFLRDGLWKKALLFVLMVTAFSFAIAFFPNRLIAYGKEMMQSARTLTAEGVPMILDRPLYLQGSSISALGSLFLSLATLVEFLLLFLVRYSFPLDPQLPLKEHILGGIRRSLGHLGATIVFLLWQNLPILLGALGIALVALLVPILRLAVLLAGIVLLFWYLPQYMLAQAAFAKELLAGENADTLKPKVKKRMKLQKKSGYCKVRLSDGTPMKK